MALFLGPSIDDQDNTWLHLKASNEYIRKIDFLTYHSVKEFSRKIRTPIVLRKCVTVEVDQIIPGVEEVAAIILVHNSAPEFFHSVLNHNDSKLVGMNMVQEIQCFEPLSVEIKEDAKKNIWFDNPPKIITRGDPLIPIK